MDKIKSWMLQTIKDGSWKNNNDLHIDIISKEFKKPETWIEGGLRCMGNAILLRDNLSLPFVIELFMNLKSSSKPIGVNFVSLKELKSQLSWSPPSLYLTKIDFKNWVTNIRKGTQIKFNDFKNNDVECFYSEILRDDPDYCRSLYFISLPKT